MITILPETERAERQMIWVEHGAEFFAECIGATRKQQRIAGMKALEHFMNGNSGARSIYYGFDAVRTLLKTQAESNGRP